MPETSTAPPICGQRAWLLKMSPSSIACAVLIGRWFTLLHLGGRVCAFYRGLSEAMPDSGGAERWECEARRPPTGERQIWGKRASVHPSASGSRQSCLWLPFMLGLGFEEAPWEFTRNSLAFNRRLRFKSHLHYFLLVRLLGKSSHLSELTICRMDIKVSIS